MLEELELGRTAREKASVSMGRWGRRCREWVGKESDSLIIEYASPVDEKVLSSTPVIRAPSDKGNDDTTWLTDRLCRTTLLRSP
jgi:hypothetical protein